MIINDDATSWIVTIETSIMLLENIYITGITYDDRHVTIIIFFFVIDEGTR